MGKLRKWFPYVSQFHLSQDLTASIRNALYFGQGQAVGKRLSDVPECFILSIFCFILVFETGFLSVALVVLELAL